MLTWLRDEKNQKLLALLGCGIAAIASAIWTVTSFLVDHGKDKPAEPTFHVEQKGTGFAAGRDNVINAPVTVNPDAKEVTAPIVEQMKALTAAQKELAAQTAREKGVEIAPLRAILVKMGEAGVKDEDIPKRLQSAADELVKLRAEVDALQRGSPAVAALAKEAEALINKGDLDGASQVLARGRAAARKQREGANRDEANILSLDARVDDLKLAYRSAAAKYGEAATLMAGGDPGEQFELLQKQQDELHKQGDEFGDNAALDEAIEVSRRSLTLVPRAEKPAEWARAQNNLGLSLTKKGERDSGAAQLEEAVATFREALSAETRDRAPLDWATAQMNLGVPLIRLAEREAGGTARLEEAVAAFRNALGELTLEQSPTPWAMAQLDLGVALTRLAEREDGGGEARLREAVGAFREALKELTRERVPLLYGQTQINMGIALTKLGEREPSPTRVEEAVAAFREALKELTRNRAPPLWAMAQNDLAIALDNLGRRTETDPRALEEAAAAYGAALEEWTRGRVPRLWAKTAGNQGVALVLLAARRQDAKLAKLARDEIAAAFTVARDNGDQPTAAYLKTQLANARKLTDLLMKAEPKNASAKR